MMTVSEMIIRARGAVGMRTRYSLGSGASFRAPHPAGDDGACDCTGYVAWVLGYPRYQPFFSWLVDLNGGWMNTDGIVVDIQKGSGLFEWRRAPQRGVIVVYPSLHYAKLHLGYHNGGPGIGHVGIVTEVDGADYMVLHCSASNFREGGDAILETSGKVFEKRSYRCFAWSAAVKEQA